MFVFDNYLLLQSYFKNSKKLMETWNLAVQEADNLMKLDRFIQLSKHQKCLLIIQNIF